MRKIILGALAIVAVTAFAVSPELRASADCAWSTGGYLQACFVPEPAR